MSDPIQNFESILKKQSDKRQLRLYNNKKQLNEHTIKPQEVISSVNVQLKAFQVADSINSEKLSCKHFQKYKKTNFLSVNKLPVYNEVPKQSSKFDTQCVSDTELINVIEHAEIIDVHQGISQEFETTFCHNTEKQDIISNENNAIVCLDDNSKESEGIQPVSKEINKESRVEAVSESKEIGRDTSMSIISPIMCSNKVQDRENGVSTVNSNKDYTQAEEFSQVFNEFMELEEHLDMSIERPLSPIFMHKHVKIKPKTPSPLIFNLDKFEQFESSVIPILETNDLERAKKVINSQILNKELHLKMDKDIELNVRELLSPVLQDKNVEKDSTTIKECKTNNKARDTSTDLEFIELDQATSNDLVNKIVNDNVDTKVKAESEILKDEILFSSDEDDSYVHKDYQDLPFTCALETSFYDQSDVLDKTMYVGFQTASNKTIQVLAESFAQAKGLLSDVSSNEVTVTDLVKHCDNSGRNKTVNDESQRKIYPDYNVKESKLDQPKDNRLDLELDVDNTVSNFKGFMTASKRKIKLSDKALSRCKKVFQDIFNEDFNDKTEINDIEGNIGIDIKKNFEDKVQKHTEIKQCSGAKIEVAVDNNTRLETNKDIAGNVIQYIESDDVLIQEFENIEMSLEDDKQTDKNEATASCKDTNISDTALSKIKEVVKDIDFDEELSEFDMKENTPVKLTTISGEHFEGFKTASNKKIHISDKAKAKTKDLFQDIDLIEFPKKYSDNMPTIDQLYDLDMPSTSTNRIVGFRTANNKDIKISDEALAKTENVFKDIDAIGFKSPTKCYERDEKPSITKTSFVGFKTANNKDVIVSNEALAKTKNIFKDIDSIDVEVNKKCNKDYAAPNKGIKNETSFDLNQPSTSKAIYKGFKTANNKAIKISNAALATTEYIFKDIDCTDFKVQDNRSRVSDEDAMQRVDSMSSKSTFIGFKTANNKDIKISNTALAKTKNVFKDVDSENFKFPSKISKKFPENVKHKTLTENDNKQIDDVQQLDFNKFSISMTNFTGFKTANNKKINISEAALCKTKYIFKDIDSTDPDKPSEEINKVDLIERKDKYEITDFNQASTSKASFIGFTTANNRKINISEESLAMTRNMFKDIDSNDFVYPKKQNRELDDTVENIIKEDITKPKASKDFKTGNNDLIKVFEITSVKTSTELNLTEKINKNHFDMEKETNKHPLKNKTRFLGFKTGNSKFINVSDEAMAKTLYIFRDIDSNDNSDLGKYTAPTDSNSKTNDTETAAVKDTITTNKNVKHSETAVPKFQGFQTASNKQVKMSADALVKSRKIFQDIDATEFNIDRNIENKHGLLCTVKDSYTHIAEDADKINGSDGKHSSVFKGFQTANKKPVAVSEEALAKSRKLFQDLDDFEHEFRGFPTSNDEIFDNAQSQAKDLLQNKIKEIMGFTGFQTANEKKVVMSEDALEKSRKLFEGIDNQERNINDKINTNIKFGFKTGTNRDIVISEEALARSKRLFSEIDTSNEDTLNMKDKITKENIANIIDTQIMNDFEVSLHTDDFHDEKISVKETPVKSKRSGSPILSCPKAKRRKRFETPYSQILPKIEIKKEIVTMKISAIKFTENYKKNKKFTLKDLAGISTGKIDPYILQFKFDNLLQFVFRDGRNDLSNGDLTIDLMKELFVNSVNSKLIPNGWLDNHLKLILWKLISYEIKFKSVVCSARNVVDQLKYRYDKELYNAQRPALRKILEKDDVASKTMVLCVAGIMDDVNEASTTTTNNTELLLTDGWYCIKASIDKMLAQLVCQGKIGVGTKLVTNGAELVNCEQGVSPWEDTSAVRLKIFGNSTRRARWDARLGYCGNGVILSQLSSVRLDGGKVTKLRVYVTRVYPALYVEKFEDGSTVTRSERLENIHQMKSEAERQAVMEKIYEEVEKEFSDQNTQDSESPSGSGNKRTCLDSGSQIAKVMRTSKDPAEFRAELTSSQSRLLEDYTSKRRERLLQDIQQRIRDKIEKMRVCANRNVVTLLKIRVAGLKQKTGVEVTKGMMSIWKPTDAVLEIIREGAWIDVMNVVPTAVRYTEIQISAGRQSVFSISKHKEPQQLKSYTKLLNRKCFTIKNLSENPSMSTDYNEIDTVGFIFLIDPSNRELDSTKQPFQNVFLADMDKHIICINFWGGLQKFGFQNVLDTGQIVACANLQKRVGNTRKSIPQYRVTEFSYFTKTPKNENARVILDDLSKKFLSLDRRKFCEECVVLKNNYSSVKHNNENISPYRFNHSDYNTSKHKVFIDSPLIRPNKLDDNFNLTGLDFESSFKQTDDTQNLPEEVLLRKKKVNEKIARLKMYGEPPPLSTIHIINKTKNASNSFKSPLLSNNNNNYSKIENTKPPYLKSDSSVNVASFKNTPDKCGNMGDVSCSPVLMNRTYVKSVNPVKIDFDVKDDNESSVDHFAEEFDASPPLSLD